MYGKEEALELRKLFWTSFGKYMGKHRSVHGNKVQWVNYKTRVKDIYFRLEADKRTARVFIDLQHRDPEIRDLIFEQFTQLKTVFHDQTETEWEWYPSYTNEYKTNVARIMIEIEGVNLYNKDTWNDIFPFFEKHMVGLDAFWVEFYDVFKNLE